VPDTGTPVVYISEGGSITGLTTETLYYTIKLTSTTFKVASTYANALAGTAIDLTASSGLISFNFLPESDFGQLACDGPGGVLGTLYYNTVGQITSDYYFGARSLPYRFVASADDWDSLMTMTPFGENRGYIKTQKIFAPDPTDNFQKIYIKTTPLTKPEDKVIVKYRTEDKTGFPKTVAALDSTATYGTWSDANTFTTTADLSAVTAGMEVEFILGAGAGYLAHISSISYSAPTYTVNIDEDIRNIAASDICWFIIDNWTKGATITTDNDKNYVEIPIFETAKWVHLKIVLRGYKVGIEEIELINSTQKPKV